MTTTSEAIAIALDHHREGRLDEAESIYRQVLAVDPRHCDALHLLGVVAHQRGQHETAVELIRRALAVRPTAADYYCNLGLAYDALRNDEEAIACYRRALELDPDSWETYINLAMVLQRQGKLDEAESCCRHAMRLSPWSAKAVYELGAVLQSAGRIEEAIAAYRKTIELDPSHAEAHNNLGNALGALGDRRAAIDCYHIAIRTKPDYAEAFNNLGVALAAEGLPSEAIACYEQALRIIPQFAEAYSNLGNTLEEQGRIAEATVCFRRALELKPGLVEAQMSLGNALREQGSLEEATALYQQAVQLKPDYAKAHNNLGLALAEQGQISAAIACYQRAIQLTPDLAEAHNNLGNALRDLGRCSDAIACYRRAIQVKPDFFEAYNNLGAVLADQGLLGEALDSCQRAVSLNSNSAKAHNNLGNVLRNLGQIAEAIACHRRAREIDPHSVKAHDNLLYAMQYQTGVSAAELAEAHAEFERQHTAPLRDAWRPHPNDRDPERPLRLGFVSPDFARHPVGLFLVRTFESLRDYPCETFCYSDRRIQDDLTARFRSAATRWQDVYGLTDERLAEQVRADQIDILFDLAGHTAGNRLLAFARKPAPIQATWIGYEGTTGLAAMDFIVADRHVIPEGHDADCSEQVVRLPDGYVSFDPPGDAPSVSRLPAGEYGCVSFGSFNNLAKITPDVVTTWSEILRRVPNARLVMKYRGLGDQAARQRYLGLFAAQGIEADRLRLLPHSTYADYLASYHEVDMALDPFPFSGSATTCEALWMGVPVVTLPGDTFAGRHGLTHMSSIGLAEEFVARDREHYIELAVRWANDLGRLAKVRAALRDRMAASPLCDGNRLAERLLRLLRDVWRKWCVQIY